MSSNKEPLDLDKNTTKAKYHRKLALDDFSDESKLVISDYTCPLCEGITNIPVVDSCGHFYCEECYDTYTKTSSICPVDNKTELNFEKSNRIPVVSNILEKQTVKCKNRDRECKWTGKLKELTNHLNDHCLKQIVPCLNNECKESICRELLLEHMKNCEYRKEECNDCKSEFPFNQLKSHHQECPKAIITCPQNCGESLLREEFQKHKDNICQFTIVPCPYADLGCNARIMKKEFDTHIETQLLAHNLNLFEMVRRIGKVYDEMFEAFNTRFLKLETPGLYKSSPSTSNKSNKNPNKIFNSFIPQAEDQAQAQAQDLSQLQPQANSIQLIELNNQISHSSLPEKEEKPASNSVNQVVISNSPIELKKEEEKAVPVPKSPISETEYLKRMLDKKIKDEIFDIASSPSEEEEIEVNNPNKTKCYFDLHNVPLGICINSNMARCVTNANNIHCYVFLCYSIRDISEAVVYEWKVKVNPTSCWIGMGLCNKEKVSKNKCKFFSSQKFYNHNTYCVSTNGYLWNCGNPAQNNKSLPDFPKKIEPGTMFYFSYNKKQKVLSFKVNEFSAKLINVYDSTLTPCILFLHKNDEVQVFF